jgi:hypothetical protein
MESPRDILPDCPRFQSEFPAYLYGEILPEAGEALERHLESCAACREELTALKETRGALDRWIVPSLAEDPATLAHQARTAVGPAPATVPALPVRRGRMTRFTARLLGAAAGLVFALSLFSTEASVGSGRLDLSFALPGLRSNPTPEPIHEPTLDDDRLRAIAQQEVSTQTASMQRSQLELSRMTREELIQEVYRLSRAVDQALVQNQQRFDSKLTDMQRTFEANDSAQRRAIQEIVELLQPRSSNEHIRPASNR